jgi:beta-glucanase (GH16 family)
MILMMILRIGIYGLLLSLGGCSKKSAAPPATGNSTLVSVKVGDIDVVRQNTGSNARFYVDLSAAASAQASVNYGTLDGTAIGGTDFVTASGTLVIPAGQTEGYVDVQIKGDSLRQADQQFYLQLSSPVNCTLGVAKGTGTIDNSDGSYLPTDSSGYTTPSAYPGYTLAWSDEFSGNSLNTQNWNFETGGTGWGNNELENYTSRSQNIFVSSGNLIIEARQEAYGGNNYTSARINTSGKQQFQFGRIDIRAKLPVSSGMWPALWMLGASFPTAGWPACGETDIMELIGKNPSQVVGSLHWKQQDGTSGTYNNVYNLSSQDFSRQFHVFSLLWAQDTVQFLVDDQVYVSGGPAELTTGAYPFNNPFFFIFNVAVGGDWPGPPDNTTVFPQRMFVDYVRVFQQ